MLMLINSGINYLKLSLIKQVIAFSEMYTEETAFLSIFLEWKEYISYVNIYKMVNL